MAKWGEGDPRWIVEERPDATNVNNWHWTEKNATDWSKRRFKDLLEGLVIEDTVGKCEIKKISETIGEAFANNRKAKLIFLYDWQLELEWSGRVGGDDTLIEGKVKIPNLSEENSIKEVDVDISVSSSSKAADQLKHLMKSKGAALIRSKLERYLTELKEEYSKDLILPTKTSNGTAKINQSEQLKADASKAASCIPSAVTNGKSATSLGVKIDTEDLDLTEEFHCAAEDIYRAFVQPEMVRAFTHSDVVLEPVKGGKFALFSGMVVGTFVDLVKNEKIVQRWRFKSWPDEHYSTVTLNFRQTDTGTVIHMTQTGIPKSDYNRTKEGWKRYYWDSLRATFGFGALLT